jgi:peptidoglycan/LPS O-acetylase OafA/YrhL
MTTSHGGPGDPGAMPPAARVETAPTGAALSSDTVGQAAALRVAGTTQSAGRGGKLPFIHGLRGFASTAVAIYHCYHSTPVSAQVAATVPAVTDHVVNLGFLGVDMFFVISGFVIALTLYKRLSSIGEWGRFFVRRQLRLDPPYWTAIVLTIVSGIAVNRVNAGAGAPVPSASDVVAHLFYLQEFLGIKQIVGVFWTLCFEVQFYLFFGVTMLLLAKSKLSGRAFGWLMLPLYVLSILCFWGVVPYPRGLFIPRWFEFFTGVVLFMYWRAQLNRTVLGVYLGVLLAALFISPQIHNNEAMVILLSLLLISVMFLFAVETGGMKTWLAAPLMRYLGDISYSLYIMHAVVGIRLLKLLVHPQSSASYAWFMFAVVLLLSIAASDLMFRFIERPSMNLSHRLKWSAA